MKNEVARQMKSMKKVDVPDCWLGNASPPIIPLTADWVIEIIMTFSIQIWNQVSLCLQILREDEEEKLD
jgi:hypothetical protein